MRRFRQTSISSSEVLAYIEKRYGAKFIRAEKSYKRPGDSVLYFKKGDDEYLMFASEAKTEAWDARYSAELKAQAAVTTNEETSNG